MASMPDGTGSDRPRRSFDLLAGALMLLVAPLAGILVLELTGGAWSLALALAVSVGAAVAAAVGLRAIVSDTEGAAGKPATWPGALAAASVAIATLAVGVLAVHHEASATYTRGATASGAEQTFRNFLAEGVIDENGAITCQYLTAHEQRVVTAMVPYSGGCRLALTQAPLAFGTLTSTRVLHQLRVIAAVHGDRALVTTSGAGLRTATFTLDRTAPREAVSFGAPPSAWRVATGVQALLRPPAHPPTPAPRT